MSCYRKDRAVMFDPFQDNWNALWAFWTHITHGHPILAIVIICLWILVIFLFCCQVYVKHLTALAKEHKGHILSLKGIVLVYTIYTKPDEQLTPTRLGLMVEQDARYKNIDDQLKEIITNNPDVDFTKLEPTLQIKVLDVQRRSQTSRSGIIIGHGKH